MRYTYIILGAVMGFTVFVSLRTLTSQPRYFYDEAVVVETAHNFARDGRLDIKTDPDTYSGYSHLFNSTGYAVSLPLALIFKIGQVSFVAGRLMMLGWLLVAIWSIFKVSRAFWGSRAGLCAAGLVASFAPFYGNGMQIMGEVPGLVFFVWGLYHLVYKEDYRFAGLFWGLAAAAKPSMYGLLLPTFVLYLFIFEKDRLRKLWKFILGSAVPIALFLVLIMPDVLSLKNWWEMLALYRNPYDSPSLAHNVILNIKNYWHHSTVLYLGLLLLAIAWAVFKYYPSLELKLKKLYGLAFIYTVLLIIYFLRSPGWFRYLFPVEMLALMFLYPTLRMTYDKKRLVLTAIVCLTVLNLAQLFFLRGDVRDTSPQDTAEFVSGLQRSVGVINAPEVSSLIPQERRYQVIKYFGVPELGTNPLLLEGRAKPDLIVFKSADNPMVIPHQAQLNSFYRPLRQIGSYRIYELKTTD